MDGPARIDPQPNGPLQVSGPVGLYNARAQRIATEATFWLCRCGGSANKPFCDGTHLKIRFSSARQADPAKAVTTDYAGQGITIHDNRAICSHAGFCTDQSPHVFRMRQEPWIDADADAVAHTIATIRQCPSGALAYSVDGQRFEHSGREPAIHIAKDGPYAVQGSVQLAGDARPVSREHYTLCRCGQSKNKPFCDGSHWAAGFKDDKN